MSSEIVLSVRDLGKHYHIYDQPHHRLLQMLFRGRRSFHRTFHALDNVTFEIHRGETIGIIGRNGAGKSTLLQLLCGTLTPSTGSIETQGRVAALLELGAGFNPEFTGRDNVYLNASILGLSRAEIDERYQKIVDFADIGEFIDQPVKTYSSGMYVRLAFAVIAHVDADILIIDEALAVGDAFFTQKCMRFLRHFCENGTLLFVSHDSGAVTSLCERAIWLEHGTIREIGLARDVCKNYAAEVYLQANPQPENQVVSTPALPAAADETDAAKADTPKLQAIDYPPLVVQDPRWKTLENTPFNNVITVQAFNPESNFGTGQMEIESVWLQDDRGMPLPTITGGETVDLVVQYLSHIQVASVIVGFQLKDRRGQILFGDNTCLMTLAAPVAIQAGQSQQGRFRFQMPLLPSGDYSITVSVAEGTQYDHVQHQWIHDAVILQSQCASVSTGIVGIPMLDICILPTPQPADLATQD